ncbi:MULTISPECIES: type II secretion system F family protein [unclassified Microbacterium]|uniref:type II secretion system F family protein n=1 Tax=unclassified Microbacterium TaxID=2609290 RepID=UPI0027E09ED8|nr:MULTISPECIES: type II secretion system F family protein [unclassified Microbacterium]
MSALASAVLIGGAFAGGVLSILTALPRWRAAALTVRIAPYVRDVVEDERIPRGVLPAAGMLPATGRTLWQRAQRGFERLLGGSEVLRQRLAQAGVATDPIAFRGRQLGWALGGIGAGSVAVIALAVAGRMSVPVVLIPVLTGVGAAMAYDAQLSARAKSRRARLTDELPTTLEFLALCLSAGEGFLDSLRRVAAVGSGELTAELRQVVLAVGTGSPLADALGDMSKRLQLPGLGRAVDQVTAALEHGAPLAGVLHAQAGDAREDAKRTLIEQAGRKEILMLLPLVFLILPLSVLFAIYPGLFILRLGIG